jgi:hypothetical protein
VTAKLLLTFSLFAPAPAADSPGEPTSDASEAAKEGPEAGEEEEPGAEPSPASETEASEGAADPGQGEQEAESDRSELEAKAPAPEVAEVHSEAASEAEGPETEGEVDLANIFGDGSGLEEMEELPEDGAEEGGAASSGFASKIPGDINFEFGILTSLYIDLDDLSVGPDGKSQKRFTTSYNSQRGNISRNENRLEFYVNYRPNEHIELVGGFEPVFMGVSDASTLDDLSSRQMIRPFHVESDKAYLGLIDVAPGLDIKVGRQIVVWGTADKFNPTNNINADDFEDRPLYTEPIANQMAVVDYSAFEDKLQLQAIWIPLFYPALLPPSASAALTDPKAPIPFALDVDQSDLLFTQNFIDSSDRFIPAISSQVITPTPALKNGQGAFKIASKIGEFDFSASYFFGFHDIPLPYYASSRVTVPEGEQVSQQPEVAECCFASTAYLRYPGMHVIGADMATQIPFLGHMGFWAEGAMFVPTRRHDMQIELPVALALPSADGLATTLEGPTVLNKPFFKLTTGVDYTAGKHVLLLAQYMHGFIDEFGFGNIGDYVMGGTQLAFRGRHVIAQVFGVLQLPKKRDIDESVASLWEGDKVSGVIAPELALVPKAGYLTFKLGAFALMGRHQSKFGQKATGSSIAYVKMQGRF